MRKSAGEGKKDTGYFGISVQFFYGIHFLKSHKPNDNLVVQACWYRFVILATLERLRQEDPKSQACLSNMVRPHLRIKTSERYRDWDITWQQITSQTGTPPWGSTLTTRKKGSGEGREGGREGCIRKERKEKKKVAGEMFNL